MREVFIILKVLFLGDQGNFVHLGFIIFLALVGTLIMDDLLRKASCFCIVLVPILNILVEI